MIKFNIWCNGDPDVGIPGDAAIVDMHIDPNEVDKEYLIFVKGRLTDCFADIWDWDEKRIYIMTDEEINKLDSSG